MTEQEIDLCRQAGIIIYSGDQPRLLWKADFMEALPKLIELSRASALQISSSKTVPHKPSD